MSHTDMPADSMQESAGTHSGSAAPRAAAGRRREILSLSQLSTDEILAEIDRREQRVHQLESRAAALRERIAQLDRELSEIGASLPALQDALAAPGPGTAESAPPARRSGGRRGPRPKNEVSLADALAGVVEVRARTTIPEAVELVLANGYQTTSRKFALAVATALAKDARFRRVERGVYERVDAG